MTSDGRLATIDTTEGAVPLWGRLESPDRPLLFVVRGAMPALDHMLDLRLVFSGVDVALVHLPGMHSPFFPSNAPAAFARAFDQVIERLGHSAALVLGVSVGGVVALTMRHKAIKHLVLVDTPLTTAHLWPIHTPFRELTAGHAMARRWIADLLGIFPTHIEGRDYRAALQGLAVPTTAIFGGLELGEPREAATTPSLVSAADRAAYAANALVTSVVIEGAGHNVAGAAMQRFIAILEGELGQIQAVGR